MKKAKVIKDERIILEQGLFVIEIKVYEVEKSIKFPIGIKLKCVLLDMLQQKPVVLVDNHEPFGFHLHSKLPDDPDFRVSLEIKDFDEAIKIFMNEVKKVVSHES